MQDQVSHDENTILLWSHFRKYVTALERMQTYQNSPQNRKTITSIRYKEVIKILEGVDRLSREKLAPLLEQSKIWNECELQKINKTEDLFFSSKWFMSRKQCLGRNWANIKRELHKWLRGKILQGYGDRRGKKDKWVVFSESRMNLTD